MANTTNLNLVKPAGTDSALISDINGNMDKIDQYAGTTNTAIDNLTMRSVGTSNNPITNLDDIPTNSRGIIILDSSVAPSGISSSISLNYQRYGNSSGSSSTLILNRPGTSRTWLNYCASGTWQGWTEIAKQDDVNNKINCQSIRVTSGGVTITLPNSATTFFMFVTRTNVTTTNAEGIYIGATGASYSHIAPIGTAASALTATISGNVISLSTTTSNLIATVIYM